jgi:hypothetical protein
VAATHANNLRILGAYSARMAAGDFDAVFDTFAPGFRSHVTGRVTPDAVEHWGGPHCSQGIGVAGARFDAA